MRRLTAFPNPTPACALRGFQHPLYYVRGCSVSQQASQGISDAVLSRSAFRHCPTSREDRNARIVAPGTNREKLYFGTSPDGLWETHDPLAGIDLTLDALCVWQDRGDDKIPVAEAVPRWEESNGQFTAPAQFEESSAMVGSGGYVAQCDAAVRKGFIRKVYGILSLQLLLTGILCAAVLSNRGADVNGWGTLGWGSTLAGSSALYWCIFILSIALLVSLFW